MAKPTATGIYSQPKRLLAEMVSESAAFRARVGVDVNLSRSAGIAALLDSTGAAKKIYLPSIDPWEFLQATNQTLLGRTLAVVWSETGSAKQVASGTRHYLDDTGALLLLLFTQPLTAHNNNDEERDLDCGNFFGGVIDDLQNLAALDDRLTIHTREDVEPCAPPGDVEAIGGKVQWWRNVTRFTWGST